MKRNRQNRTLRTITLVTLAAMITLASNVFFVTIEHVHLRSGTDLSIYAETANIVSTTVRALRGNIYDRNGTVIAQDNRTYDIYCVLDPTLVNSEGNISYIKEEDRKKTAEILADVLKMDYDAVLKLLSQKGIFQTELGNKGRSLTKAVRDEIESYKLDGVGFTDSLQRVYPLGTFASNLIGYAQADESGNISGKMGLEQILNTYLTGTNGSRTYQADKQGHILPGMRETVVSEKNGYNVTLTLDQTIQNALEQSFHMTEDMFDCDRVWGAAMEIKSGKIVAWGQSPSFDPNKLEIEEYNNYGSELPYEPGSTLKTFTWAAAINEGVYNGSDTTNGYAYCYGSDGKGNPVRVSNNEIGCIYNAHHANYGALDYDHGLIYSANSAATAIQTELITPEIHLDYLRKFGFFKDVGTDGLPEAAGILNFSEPSEKLSLSYGQGSSVNVLQMLQAYSAIFGDGTMVKPYFVESVRDAYDPSRVIYQAETQKVGRPITADTAKEVQGILYRTVNDSDGTAKYYQIPECKLMGKTGTTELAVGGTYESGKTITSIMCALPAEDPQVIVYYCFQARYDQAAHVRSDAAVNFIRTVALTYGFTGDIEPVTEEEPEETAEYRSWNMPMLLNHSVDYAEKKLNAYDCDVYVLGSGSTVIDQFPRSTDTVTSGQRVFLLTDTTSFVMPDMEGWTRKDVAALWAVSGFGFQLSGEGKVVSQSVPAGTTVTKGSDIKVVFE
ncbi:MAG: penicillin-binding protein [Solobacterium sp.]|nr:penicillin-binding protein [Solobacterium sp.]